MPSYGFSFFFSLQTVAKRLQERLQTLAPADCEPTLHFLVKDKMKYFKRRKERETRKKTKKQTATKTDVDTKWAFSPILEIFAGMQNHNLLTCTALVFS